MTDNSKLIRPGILRHQLVNLRHMDEAHGKELDALVRLTEKVLDPFHRLRMEEEVGPFHKLVAAQAPELCRVGRFLLDVVEDELPVLVGRLGRVKRFAIGMIQFVTELALDRAIPAKAQWNLARVHFLDEDLTIVRAILEDRSGLENRKRSGHGRTTLPVAARGDAC